MTGPQEIHQFECRWQPAEDLSPIAASMPLSTAKGWFDRLALWVGPVQPGDGVPADSVRYEIFADGNAALAWRQWNTQAIALQDETDRRPLVARVLVGDVRLLGPEIAVTLCRAGLPKVIGPLPGTVPPGAALPAIQRADLLELMRYTAPELDRLACAARGLDRLIAAVLTECSIPLSVQLPERAAVQPPQAGSQASFLWGLWRTVLPLLQDSDRWPQGKRGWSFSTFELPPDDKDIGRLADIVFRANQVQPQTTIRRKEVTVRPHDQSEPVEPGGASVLAAALMTAFKNLGGTDLMHHLVGIAEKYDRLDLRLQAAYDSLSDILRAVPDRADPAGPVSQRSAGQPETQVPHHDGHASAAIDEGAVSPGPAAQAVYQPDSRPAAADTPTVLTSQAEPSQEPEIPPIASWVNSPRAAPPAPAGRAQQAPPLYGADGRPTRGETVGPSTEPPRPGRLAWLLDQLYAGPDDAGFGPAQQALLTESVLASPGDRALARDSMPERRWYIQPLVSDDPWYIENTLEALFRLTVLPDLATPGVAEELARWTDELRAPVPVVKALSAAAYHWNEEARESMRRGLEPAIYKRWLSEKGVYVEPPVRMVTTWGRSAPAGSRRAAHAHDDANLLLRISGGKLESEVIASILAVICAFLTVLLVLVIVR